MKAQRRHVDSPAQLELTAVVGHEQPARWGGKRRGAGRKRAGSRASVAHRPREVHKRAHPVHVTLRGRTGLPSFRTPRVNGMLRGVLFGQRKRRYAGTFQVVEFSIQDNHLHLIVEAYGEDPKRALRSGVSGLVIAFAKRLNMMLGRKGSVWADRWHGRELTSPRQVRNTLVYVFRNVVKHGMRVIGKGFVDPLSSAWRFRGWTTPVMTFPETGTWPETPPRTWLLREGWTVHGSLDTRETSR